jgi:hypothetical protein
MCVEIDLSFHGSSCTMKPSQILNILFEHAGRQLSLACLRDKRIGSVHNIA